MDHNESGRTRATFWTQLRESVNTLADWQWGGTFDPGALESGNGLSFQQPADLDRGYSVGLGDVP